MTEIQRRIPHRNWSAPATDCGGEGRDLNRFPQAAFGVQGLSSLRSSIPCECGSKGWSVAALPVPRMVERSTATIHPHSQGLRPCTPAGTPTEVGPLSAEADESCPPINERIFDCAAFRRDRRQSSPDPLSADCLSGMRNRVGMARFGAFVSRSPNCHDAMDFVRPSRDVFAAPRLSGHFRRPCVASSQNAVESLRASVHVDTRSSYRGSMDARRGDSRRHTERVRGFARADHRRYPTVRREQCCTDRCPRNGLNATRMFWADSPDVGPAIPYSANSAILPVLRTLLKPQRFEVIDHGR